MTTLNFALAHAVARTLRAGRRDRRHRARPRRERRAVAAGRRGPRARRAHRAAAHAPTSTLDVDALEALLGDAHADRRVHARVERGRLDPRRAAHRRRRARRRRARLGRRRCTSRRTAAPTARRSASTSCSARRTSSSARTSGIAAIRRDLAETWPADRVRPATEDPPGHRFETGTPSFEALAGLVAAIDYLRDARRRRPRRRLRRDPRARGAPCASGCSRASPRSTGVTLHGIADPARVAERTPTFCVTVDGRGPREVAEALAADGVHVWDGDYYALHAHAARSAWPRTAAPCAPASCTTRPRTRSTGCWPVSHG